MEDTDSDKDLDVPPTKMAKFKGAATYLTKFKNEWRKEFSFVTSVPGDPYRYLMELNLALCLCMAIFIGFRCIVCDKKLKCSHMGRKDIIAHSETNSHRLQAKQLQSQSRLSFSKPCSSEASQRTEAELKIAVLAAHSNIPLAFHDKLSPAIRLLFPDSKIASSYHSASTKATCMFISDLLTNMKAHPFSICIDGSNDSGLEKMNLITVRIYDVNTNSIVTRFLDMCTSVSSTAEALYTVVESRLCELLQCENPWIKCISVGVDNTSVNIGVRNSLKS